jgi:branched-chain amino acid transport system permease protein
MGFTRTIRIKSGFAVLLQQLLNGFVTGNIYGLTALGFTIVFGIVRVANFAHGELYTLGAFSVFFFHKFFHLPFLLNLMAGMIVIGFVAILFDLIGFRPLRNAPHESTLISAVALTLLVENGALVAWGPEPKYFTTSYADYVLRFYGLTISLQRVLIVIVCVALVILLNFIIQRTRLGLAMRACAQNREAAGWVGVSFSFISSATFAISGALAAAAGGLMIPLSGVEPSMGMGAILKAFAVVILGGLGSVPGAIIGGYIIGMTEALTIAYFGPTYKDVFIFAILLLIIIIKPSGISGQRVQTKL